MAEELTVALEIKDTAPLDVLRLTGREAISELFSFDLWFQIQNEGQLPDSAAPGVDASLVFKKNGARLRVIHGMLERVAVDVEGDASAPTYRAHLVPRMYRSRLVHQQRVFMDVSVLDVAKDKLAKVGLGDGDVLLNTLSSYPQREFIVQYQEDDVAFISRLTEHAGVAFYFDHQAEVDRIVFVDHRDGFGSDEGCESITLSSNLNEPNRVYRISHERSMATGLAMVYDYNYRTPEVALKAKAKVERGHGGGFLEYPCHVKTADEASALAQIRAEETTVHQSPYVGSSSIVHLAAGLRTRFDGSDHIDATPLLITSVEHNLEPVGGSERATIYQNSFTAVDGKLPFRPKRVTPRPRIAGIVTGIVQGTSSDEGSTNRAIIDEHGRYKIHFHFDQALGGLLEKASRYCRMAQSFTGSSEGMHFPLKPGVEVAIAFVDGDPDRPVIVGALPNYTQPSVVTAANADVNRISTNTGVSITFGKVS